MECCKYIVVPLYLREDCLQDTQGYQIWGCWSPYIKWCAAATAKSRQSCPTLSDPTDGSPPGSPIPGILQARTLEWVAISFSNAWKWKVKVKSLSCVWLFVTPWTAAHQAPPSMGFSRQEYWSGLPLPSLIINLNLCKSSQPSILLCVYFSLTPHRESL